MGLSHTTLNAILMAEVIGGAAVMLVVRQDGSLASLGQWLYDWQTLVAGFIAFLGALFTVLKLREQITQNEQHKTKELTRQQNAARVVLPLALSEIEQFYRAAVSQIVEQIRRRDVKVSIVPDTWDDEMFRERFAPINTSPEAISELKTFAETLRGPKSVRHVAALVSNIQIFTSRYNTLKLDRSENLTRTELLGLLVLVGKIKLLNDSMYEFGRFGSDSFALVGRIEGREAWQKIGAAAKAACLQFSGPLDFEEALDRLIDWRIDHNEPAWKTGTDLALLHD